MANNEVMIFLENNMSLGFCFDTSSFLSEPEKLKIKIKEKVKLQTGSNVDGHSVKLVKIPWYNAFHSPLFELQP